VPLRATCAADDRVVRARLEYAATLETRNDSVLWRRWLWLARAGPQRDERLSVLKRLSRPAARRWRCVPEPLDESEPLKTGNGRSGAASRATVTRTLNSSHSFAWSFTAILTEIGFTH